jgi:hypothetical protein
MSHVGAMREVVCAWNSAFLQSEQWTCQFSSAAYVVTRPTYGDSKVCETHAEGDFVDVILLISYHPGFVGSIFWG